MRKIYYKSDEKRTCCNDIWTTVTPKNSRPLRILLLLYICFAPYSSLTNISELRAAASWSLRQRCGGGRAFDRIADFDGLRRLHNNLMRRGIFLKINPQLFQRKMKAKVYLCFWINFWKSLLYVSCYRKEDLFHVQVCFGTLLRKVACEYWESNIHESSQNKCIIERILS